MANLDDVFKGLEGLENGAELVEAAKKELSKKNNEAKNLRDTKKATEATLSSLFSALDLDAGSSVDDFTKALEAKIATKDDGSTSEIAKLAATVKKLTDDNEASRKATETERTKRLGLKKNSALLSELNKNKAYNPDVLLQSLSGNVTVGEDESMVFDLDGEEVTIEAGVKSFLEKNPGFVINTQNGGSGGGNGGGSSHTMTKEQYADPAYYQANAEKIRSGEIKPPE